MGSLNKENKSTPGNVQGQSQSQSQSQSQNQNQTQGQELESQLHADDSMPIRPSLDQNIDQQIAAILVVGFHHAYGPIVEFCLPPLPQSDHSPDNLDDANGLGQNQTSLEKLELPEEWSFLPFLALPDGAHQKDEDFAYFHLPPVPGWSVAETTLFGISCNRQIPAKDLLVTTPDITRSIVQKAVVVLARQPIFGPLRQKLAVITAAWFNQRDFTQIGILYNLYNSLNNTFYGPIDDSTLYMGTSLRELLHRFKGKTLMLLKLLLLEKKILFYGYPVEILCTFQYSLISLIPGLLRCLQDAGAPDLDTAESTLEITEARELANGTKESLLRYMGLPLRIFEKGSFFQPYLPLQQIEMLSSEKTRSYLVGTTNQIFFRHKNDTNIDVLVNVETGTIEFYNQQLASVVNPTMADRRWTEKIVKVVNSTWDPNDPARPLKNTFYGSDDYLRARFEEYVLSLLSSMKHAQASSNFSDNSRGMHHSDSSSEEVMRDDDRERNYLSDYGMSWIMAWRETNNFRIWNKYTDHEIYEIVEPGHPGMGNISINDIQNTLSNRLKDLQLRQNLAPLRQTFSKAMSGGAKAVSTGRSRFLKGMDALWTEFERGPQDEINNNSHYTNSESDTVLSQPITQIKRANERNDEIIQVNPPLLESTSQQAGRILSSFSSFLSRKQKEFTQAMDESVAEPGSSGRTNRDVMPRGVSRAESPMISAISDDDNTSAFVDVGAMYPFTLPHPILREPTGSTVASSRQMASSINSDRGASSGETTTTTTAGGGGGGGGVGTFGNSPDQADEGNERRR